MTSIESRALGMLDSFAGVGTKTVDITLTDIEGKKVLGGYRSNISIDALRRIIAARLQHATTKQQNFIIRPRATGAALIQLDDLAEPAAQRIARYAFMVLATSPGNFQAWV